MDLRKSELIVDGFAGGGGASLGIAWALGRSPDIAINHDAAAIAMHEANHPDTKHFRDDIWHVEMRKVVGKRKVGLAWCSPDCKHFSSAKGNKPVEKNIRSLAWVAVKWAKEIQPRVIMLENVREFADWGPLVPVLKCQACEWEGTEGQAILCKVRSRCPRCNSLKLRQTANQLPDPSRKGLTFRRFVGRLKALGYEVQWKNLDAADYGAPTHRRRLFLIARRDGCPIVWPEPTHGNPKSLDNAPLFERLKPWRTAAECIDWSIPCPSIFERKRPLKDATLRRIAAGIKRYVIDAEKPFVVNMAHGGKLEPMDEPLSTIATEKGGCRAVVAPILSKYHGQKGNESRCKGVQEPIDTLDTQNRFGMVVPVIERQFSQSKCSDANTPLPTTTAGGGGKSALVSAFIAKHYGGTVGVEVDKPLPTTTMRGTQNQVVAASLVHMNHGAKQWSSVEDPMRTVTTNNHAALVYSFMLKYYGTGIGQAVDEPLGTATTKDRFGLVTVMVEGEPYVIVDIGMRMLTPRELARAQGFPDTYIMTGTKTSQVARIGNSVCPVMSKALVEANLKGSGVFA